MGGDHEYTELTIIAFEMNHLDKKERRCIYGEEARLIEWIGLSDEKLAEMSKSDIEWAIQGRYKEWLGCEKWRGWKVVG